AYAPEASPPVDRAHIVAASSPILRNAHSAASRNLMAANDVTTGVAKAQGQDGVVAASTRVVASRASDEWLRIMMLAPSASTSMTVTMLGDPNMTLLSHLFVKPQTA